MTTEDETENQVQLAIYDLSHGMASQLSAQFLGSAFRIDAIPHTGVVVFGQEYFYGSGIQSELPSRFRQMTGMVPVQVISLGRTSVSRLQFEEWCRQQMSLNRFTPLSYDLLHCNCNHFAHVAAVEGLQMSSGIPDWVLQVPQRFLASPMGQIVRPMLEQMQLRAPVDGAHSLSSNSTINSLRDSASSANVEQVAAANPWAQIQGGSDDTSETKEHSLLDDHPMLDSFVKPLLSKDMATVPICFQKIQQATDQSNSEAGEFIEQCRLVVVSGERLTMGDEVRLGRILYNCLKEKQASAFVLMLLRVLVTDQNLAPSGAYKDCLKWMNENIVNDSEDRVAGLSTATRAMSWLVLSNAVANAPVWQTDLEEEGWIQAAIRAFSDSEQSVRQAAGAFCYNVALLHSSRTLSAKAEKEDSSPTDTQVSLLCACLETLDDEQDDTTTLRKLMTVGVITRNVSAMDLVLDLELDGIIKTRAASETSSNDGTPQSDAEKALALSSELHRLLSRRRRDRER